MVVCCAASIFLSLSRVRVFHFNRFGAHQQLKKKKRWGERQIPIHFAQIVLEFPGRRRLPLANRMRINWVEVSFMEREKKYSFALDLLFVFDLLFGLSHRALDGFCCFFFSSISFRLTLNVRIFRRCDRWNVCVCEACSNGSVSFGPFSAWEWLAFYTAAGLFSNAICSSITRDEWNRNWNEMQMHRECASISFKLNSFASSAKMDCACVRVRRMRCDGCVRWRQTTTVCVLCVVCIAGAANQTAKTWYLVIFYNMAFFRLVFQIIFSTCVKVPK